MAVVIHRVALVALLMVGTTGSVRADAGTHACRNPQITRSYSQTSLTYRIKVDFMGCQWWDGSPNEVLAVLSRYDGVRPEVTVSVVPCSADDGTRADTGGCEAVVILGHPPVEAARYAGDISYRWADGDRVASFEAICESGVTVSHCQDVPSKRSLLHTIRPVDGTDMGAAS
jgi:hypothetical protein